ncbi:transposase [Leuconostoc mesenteroides]|uniref:transposase n=1 Tax=Leuconostoc mesenteroides TaxID=1245 RepID=UPI00192E73E6|nr:transposase [Leuconostoc mesenteroides]
MIRYKKEFKQSLVEMHNQGRSYTDLSAEYGPSVDSIRNWVKLYAVHIVVIAAGIALYTSANDKSSDNKTSTTSSSNVSGKVL